MAVARIATFPRGTKEQYDALAQLMGDGVAEQPERRLLAAGPSAGGWTIIQVWDSMEALERFVAMELRPAMERAGDAGYPEPPTVTDVELADLQL